MSVSPVDNIGNQGLNVGDEDEDLGAEVDEETVEAFGICGDRLGLEREDAVVRRLVDPKLPTQEEVDSHYLMGHLPYRNWCPICVRAKGKDLDH